MKTVTSNRRGLMGCVTGELVIRKIGYEPWDYDKATFIANGVEIYPGMVVLHDPSIVLTSFVAGYHTPALHEQHAGRWCVPISRIKTLTFDECSS